MVRFVTFVHKYLFRVTVLVDSCENSIDLLAGSSNDSSQVWFCDSSGCGDPEELDSTNLEWLKYKTLAPGYHYDLDDDSDHDNNHDYNSDNSDSLNSDNQTIKSGTGQH